MLWLVLISLGLIAYFVMCLAISRKATFTAPSRDLLICAAHSDDCVIMGAEIAYGSLRDGFSVRIIFLTCSAVSEDTEIAKLRAQEAIDAWGSISVGRKEITFINLPQSEDVDTLQSSDAELLKASEKIEAELQNLPEGGLVVIPAAGETHTDHRAMRKATLLAAIRAERHDLTFVETPEYNAHLSMMQDPWKVVSRLLRSIPLLNKFMTKEEAFAGFASGSAGAVYRDTPQRVQSKRAMFEFFESQNPELLRHYFGAQTRYRILHDLDPTESIERRRYYAVLARHSDGSVLVFLTLVLGLIGAASNFFFESVVDFSVWWHLVFVVLFAVISLLSVFKKRFVFGMLTCAALIGLLIALL